MNKLLTFVLILSGLLLSQTVLAYTYVRGYYRDNGTYVKPYIRSNPNSYLYDNYNYSNSNLYNNSYLKSLYPSYNSSPYSGYSPSSNNYLPYAPTYSPPTSYYRYDRSFLNWFNW